jgi:hypothetical protein
MPERFEIEPVGPYALASSARFLEGFAPAAYEGFGEDELRFAFVADGLADGRRREARGRDPVPKKTDPRRDPGAVPI